MVTVVLSLVAIVLSVGAWIGYRILWNRQDISTLNETLVRVERILERMELATFVVASDLSEAQEQVGKVATDLAESQRRADKVTSGAPGEAADASAQSGNTDER